MQRILVVDDDKDILEVLKYILEDSGYVVETLSDGHFLFDKIKDYVPDLILLDIMLGTMDGRELCKLLKSATETHDIPVILVSASHTVQGFFNADLGPNDFVAKPFDISELLNCVQKQLAA
jgi:DNA-binding response OmpR family regulator